MWPDGICKVADGRYTKTIQFQDINYQLSQNEDKAAIFEGWCDFLNYFDSSIRFQLSFLNLAASKRTFANTISIPLQGDDFDSIRTEYSQMLQDQLARGNNGLIKTKYLTFSIEADGIRTAKPRLELVCGDYPAVLIAFFLGYFAHCAPERECFAGPDDDAVYLFAGKVDIYCLVLLKHRVYALSFLDKVIAVCRDNIFQSSVRLSFCEPILSGKVPDVSFQFFLSL